MLAQGIKRLLQSRGYDVVLKREASGGSYDPATGGVTGGSVATETMRGAFIDYSDDEIDGTRISVTDRKLLLRGSGTTMVPTPGDLVDDTVRIIRVRTIRDGDGLISYSCQVRG